PDHSDIREGNPRSLGLEALKRASLLWPPEERGARLRPVGVGLVALRLVTGAAVGTRAAGDRRGDHDPITGLDVPYVRPHVLHDPDAFVAQDRARDHAGNRPADEVQVGAADRAG